MAEGGRLVVLAAWLAVVALAGPAQALALAALAEEPLGPLAGPARDPLPAPQLPSPASLVDRAREALAPVAPEARDPDRDAGGKHASTKWQEQDAGVAPPGELPGGLAGTALAVSAASVAAAALAYFWPAVKWALAPLYTRTTRETVLLHDTRERIYRLVKDQPGIHAHDLAQQLGMGWGTAVHHLKVLEQHGHIVSFRDGRYRRFFVAGDQRAQYREAVAMLRHPTSRRVAAAVAERPGLIQKQVCEAVGVSSSLAAWHLKRLARAGIVAAQKHGRTMQYRPGPAWEGLQRADAR